MTTQVLPIDSLMKEVSALIERELYQMLDKYMKNYKKYKKTYKHVMKLPAIRKLKDFKKTKVCSKGNKGIISMLINQINELTAEVSALKTALYNYENDNGSLNNTIYEINTILKWSTNIQISDLEYIEMIERLNKDNEYFTQCVEVVLNKIDYIV